MHPKRFNAVKDQHGMGSEGKKIFEKDSGSV